MAAEARRELGPFDPCLEMLKFEFPGDYMKAANRMRNLAEDRITKVQPLGGSS